MESLSQYRKKTKERKDAERFVNQEGDKNKEGNVSFGISPSHCSLKLVRAGQYSTGGDNYWNSPDAFNKALIKYIIYNRDTIFPDVIAVMANDETQALINCDSDLKAVLAEIEAAKATTTA